MKSLIRALSILYLATAQVALGAPASDGSVYRETFTSYPEDVKSQAINVGTVVSDGAVRVTTVAENEGVFRASPLQLGPEYVLEFDWTLHGPSGDNFYMLYAQRDEAPYFSDVALRTIPAGSGWIFQVDYGVDPFFLQSAPLNYDQRYHVAVHVKPGPAKLVDVYLDGALFGEFAARNPHLTTDLLQWGDPSSAVGFGDATLDNISVGLPVADPGLPADFDGSGLVDGDDLTLWILDFGSGTDADADGDGDVDGNDLLIWQRDFGSGVASIAAIPEPGAVGLAVMAVTLATAMSKARYRRFPRDGSVA